MPGAQKTRRLIIVIVSLAATISVAWLGLGWASNAAFRRGLQAKREWKLAEAISYLNWARRLKRSDVRARLELGLCEQLRGDFIASQNHLQPLITAGITDLSQLSRIHNAIGVNHYSFAQPDAAIASHELALTHARAAGDRQLEAQALIDLSRAFYHSKGKFYEAQAHLEQALAIGKEVADERIQAAALRNLGVIFWWFKGELDRPVNEFYFPALELYRRQDDQRGAATMLTLIALVHNNKGDIYQFMRYQNESVEIQERIGDQAGLADSFMTLGILYNGTGNYRKARDYFSRGLDITRRTGYRLAENDLNALTADVQVNLEEYDEALKLYDPELKHRDPNSVVSNYVLQYVAHCYQLKGDYVQALSLYERALEVHRQAGLPDVRFRTNTLLRSAECSIALRDWTRAARYWKQAEKEAETGEIHSEGEIRAALVAASIAQHENRHDDALKCLQQALDVEAQIFAAAKTNLLIPPHRRSYDLLYAFLFSYVPSGANEPASRRASELAFGFFENMRYRSLRNFIIQVKDRRAAVPATQAERDLNKRIKALTEALKNSNTEGIRAQLRRAYADYEELTLKTQLQQTQYLAISGAKPLSLAEVQERTPDGYALVEFIFVGQRVFALLITNKALRAMELPASRDALAAKVRLFRSLVFTDSAGDVRWLPAAQSLRAILIEPLENSAEFKGINTIVLAPYGMLHDLPFAALATEENGKIRFLVEDYALFRTPSATFFAHEPSLAQALKTAPKTLAFGRNEANDANLPSLAFAAEEALAVARATGGKAFVNQHATETDFKRLADEFDYLHLSTHGIAESEMPLFSRMLFEATATDDGSLTVREIFELGLRTELVTLSACETGQSFSSSGHDFVEQDRIGLVEAFLHAGSRSVLATLLPVNDRGTTEFMKRFYAELSARKSRAEALAATQRAMLRGELSHDFGPQDSGVPSGAPPRYWAPFILVGESR